jgi:hypothetical protein
MKKVLAAIAMCGLLAAPAVAVSDNVAAAVKTIEQVGNDPAKLKTYCEMSKLMSTGDDEDESKAEALDKQMQGYMKELGTDFEAAFEAGADLDPDSEDGKAYDAALDGLDGKCGT